jgi:hypothetical protein
MIESLRHIRTVRISHLREWYFVAHIGIPFDGETEIFLIKGKKLWSPLTEMVDLEYYTIKDAARLIWHHSQQGFMIHTS